MSGASRQQALQADPFRVDGPLPQGTVVLEASAGTGKTWTVAALVTRYVAEGLAALPELLVITFGRAASQELRERVRERMVEVERALADPGSARSSTDPLVALLSAVEDVEVARRRDRLVVALADFDAATIATTHQFCQQVLTGLGVAGDTDGGSELVDSLDEITVEVVDDIFLRSFGGTGTANPKFDREEALRIGRAAVDDPGSALVPLDAEPSSTAHWRFRFAVAVREEVERRKRLRRVLGYDDLLSRLADALRPEDSAARVRMRDRWRVVLVDEFQDTDHVQWEVLRLAFHGHATLVLIGDPKQAIYAFRGGDIVTYLSAVDSADREFTLDRNWRSDQPLSSALHLLMGDAALGDPRIRVRDVRAQQPGSRLHGAPSGHPVRVRVVRREQIRTTKKYPPVADLRRFVAEDLAADIAAVLTSGATWTDTDGDRPLTAGDFAVLVATHAQGDEVYAALGRHGVPRVMSGASNVYATAAGREWYTLLSALEQPHRAGWARAAALTPFFGRTPEELGAADEGLTDTLTQTLRDWSDELRFRGVAGLSERMNAGGALWSRVLSRPGGERLLTDLRQVGEGLQRAMAEGRLGLPALMEWLTERREGRTAPSGDDRARRLDSDAASVQIVTLHASKGLEYPIVHLPFAFERNVRDDDSDQVLLLHDPDGRRILDVGGSTENPGRSLRRRTALVEDAGESLRLLYVGLTRAKSQVVCWWAPSYNTADGALHRLLLGRTPDGLVPDKHPVPSDDVAWEQLKRLQDDGAVQVELARHDVEVAPTPTAGPAAAPAIGRFDRQVDLLWRRTSYSALTAPGALADQQHHAQTSEPEDPQRDDENDATVLPEDEPVPTDPLEVQLRALDSPMLHLPTGAAFGTLVHAVLEELDPASEVETELVELCRAQLAALPLPVGATDLATGLLPALRTPLGRRLDGRTFLDFPLADRLSELTFELPLAGGDTPGRRVVTGDLVPVLDKHLVDDPWLASYPARLLEPDLAGRGLRGYLTGSIDAVLRTPEGRFVVVDHKTNWLGSGTDPQNRSLTAWHYRPAAMAAEMMHSHYPLQAILYQVALHRFLRWRLPTYRPEDHLGGALYLFLRGMCGPDTPVIDGMTCGVFDWQPPVALIEDLSLLLHGGRP